MDDSPRVVQIDISRMKQAIIMDIISLVAHFSFVRLSLDVGNSAFVQGSTPMVACSASAIITVLKK